MCYINLVLFSSLISTHSLSLSPFSVPAQRHFLFPSFAFPFLNFFSRNHFWKMHPNFFVCVEDFVPKKMFYFPSPPPCSFFQFLLEEFFRLDFVNVGITFISFIQINNVTAHTKWCYKFTQEPCLLSSVIMPNETIKLFLSNYFSQCWSRVNK